MLSDNSIQIQTKTIMELLYMMTCQYINSRSVEFLMYHYGHKWTKWKSNIAWHDSSFVPVYAHCTVLFPVYSTAKKACLVLALLLRMIHMVSTAPCIQSWAFLPCLNTPGIHNRHQHNFPKIVLFTSQPEFSKTV